MAAVSGKMLSWSFSLFLFCSRIDETTSDQPSNLKKIHFASALKVGLRGRAWEHTPRSDNTIYRSHCTRSKRRTLHITNPRERLRLRISEKEEKKTSEGKIETNSIYLHTQQMVEIYISPVSEGEKTYKSNTVGACAEVRVRIQRMRYGKFSFLMMLIHDNGLTRICRNDSFWTQTFNQLKTNIVGMRWWSVKLSGITFDYPSHKSG